MKYGEIVEGRFLNRPNRFIAYVNVDGRTEKVHVKNTGRCKELLVEEGTVYLEKSGKPGRVTDYDLIAARKGERLINMDSNAPNKAVGEWLWKKELFPSLKSIRAEKTYKNSRFDFYVETEEDKVFLEVKGVTLERENGAYFPDAPSQRAVKHVEELIEAAGEGYKAYILFIIQMKGIDFFAPNVETHPAFAQVLRKAEKAGVEILAYDCRVTEDSMEVADLVPVRLGTEERDAEDGEKPEGVIKEVGRGKAERGSHDAGRGKPEDGGDEAGREKAERGSHDAGRGKAKRGSHEALQGEPESGIRKAEQIKTKSQKQHPYGLVEQIGEPLLKWYDSGRRILPWRENPQPYYVWLSEIMLQQTRVEAVKPYFDNFIANAPDIRALAKMEEDKLVKLWEGLGYYNRVRNLQKAAKIIMDEYGGTMPSEYENLIKLPGIGSYTAGAIASIAYGKPVPAVDGNVLRVLARLRLDGDDILSQKTKSRVEKELQEIIPSDRPGDFNQALMELGAMVCLPNGEPKCGECPWEAICQAHCVGKIAEYPKKKAKKARKIEEKTVLVIQDGEKAAFRKRPKKGLLAGMYEFPMLEGYRTEEEVLKELKHIGLKVLHIKPIGEAKHIFSHKEWHMAGYAVRVDELEEAEGAKGGQDWIFIDKDEARERYPIPSAYAAYAEYLDIKLGMVKN